MKVSIFSTLNAFQLGHILSELKANDVQVDSVIMDPKVPTPKELEIEQERTEGKLPDVPLERFADQRIPFFFVDRHDSDMTVHLMRERSIDLVVNAGTPRILKERTLQAPRVGVLNVHPGILPMFRGCTCVEWAVYLDEPVGNTVHFMVPGIDEGPIVETEGLSFEATDNYSDVRVKTYRAGFTLMARGVRRVIDEDINPDTLPQQGEGRYFKPIASEQLEDVKEKLASGRYTFQGRVQG